MSGRKNVPVGLNKHGIPKIVIGKAPIGGRQWLVTYKPEGGGYKEKVTFPTENAAVAFARLKEKKYSEQHAYYCAYHCGWHLGHGGRTNGAKQKAPVATTSEARIRSGLPAHPKDTRAT